MVSLFRHDEGKVVTVLKEFDAVINTGKVSRFTVIKRSSVGGNAVLKSSLLMGENALPEREFGVIWKLSPASGADVLCFIEATEIGKATYQQSINLSHMGFVG